MSRAAWLVGGGAAILVLALATDRLARSATSLESSSSYTAGEQMAASRRQGEAPLVTLYKSPTCTCCSEWADHMRANGFRVEVEERPDVMKVKEELSVPAQLSSCHTAVVEGYALEGHAPADVIRRLLAERPEIVGLAVPGMPPGVPGMPDADHTRPPYDIWAFRADGTTQLYASR